jgi:GTP-binding protein
MSILLTARFHTTVAKAQQLPRVGLPEIAFIGRSNSGKSSAINVICQRRRLAFSSRTPGRTQALNYFALGPEDAPTAFLVDMPGYGFASAPREVRAGWDALAGRYLRERAELRGVVLTVDIRRLFTELDRTMLKWLPPGLAVLVLITKSDKYGFEQQGVARRAATEQLRELRPDGTVALQLFSASKHKGIDEARATIEHWLATPAGTRNGGGDEPAAPPEATEPV